LVNDQLLVEGKKEKEKGYKVALISFLYMEKAR